MPRGTRSMRAALLLSLAMTGAAAFATPAPAAPVAPAPSARSAGGWPTATPAGRSTGYASSSTRSRAGRGTGRRSRTATGSGPSRPRSAAAQRIAVFRPTSPGDCSSLPLASGPVPEWVFDVPLTPADPLKATPPPEAATISDGTDRVDVCLGDTTEFRGGCDRKLTGKGALSGSVVKTGPQPVEGACIYVFTDVQGDSDVGWDAMTDVNGRWQVSGLPTDRKYYIGVVAPFETAAGPCQTENGPPPTPPTGAAPARVLRERLGRSQLARPRRRPGRLRGEERRGRGRGEHDGCRRVPDDGDRRRPASGVRRDDIGHHPDHLRCQHGRGGDGSHGSDRGEHGDAGAGGHGHDRDAAADRP